MQEKIINYFNNFAQSLTMYDYLGFAILLLVFILFIVLAILARNRIGTALFFSLFAFMLLIAGPFGVKFGFDQLIRKNSVGVEDYKKLVYSDSVTVDLNITNKGKIDFSKCEVKVFAVKDVKNSYLQHLYNLKPLARSTKVIEDIQIGQTKEFKSVIDNFTKQDGFNIRAKGECYP